MKLPEQAQKIIPLLPLAVRKKLPTDIRAVWVSTAVSRRLNFRYRKKDESTNVLSFRYGVNYGELLLCRTVIRAEALEQKGSFDAQMTWMIVHGMLHLAGIHHEVSAIAEQKFKRIEQTVLQKYQKHKR